MSIKKTTYIDKYNEAVSLISFGDYESARQLLLDAEDAIPNTSLVNKILGSIELLTGYPHLALSRWGRFSLEELGVSEERIKWANSLLNEYHYIYERYNNALVLIKQGEFERALSEFSEITGYANQLVLPLTIYRGYFLLLARVEPFEKIVQMIDRAPQYVKLSADIQKLQRLLEDIHNRSVPQRIQRKSKQLKAILVANLLLIAGLASAIYLMNNYSGPIDDEIKKAASLEKLQLAGENNSIVGKEEKVATLTSQLQALEKLRNDIQSQVEAAEKKIASQEAVLTLSGIKQEELQLKAANRSYLDGYKLFQLGKYEQAIESFRISDSFKIQTYFADDNLYYWSQSYNKLGRVEEATRLYDRFLSETDLNYTKSPLLDDVLLAKAESLLARGATSEAKTLLQRIVSAYPGEWTANRAQQLLKPIN